jgi:tripartite-type tricarboxylate transporter receptor subunit TctC
MRFVLQFVSAVALGAAALVSPLCSAQTFPAKQLQIVVPFGPGGSTDLVARLIAGEMQRIASQPVIVENRPGASGAIAAEQVAKSGTDGHTLYFGTPTTIFVPGLMDPPPRYDPVKVLAPVIHLFDTPTVLLARPGLPEVSLRDVIAVAKKSPPGHYSFGVGAAVGTRSTYVLELLMHLTGIKFTAVGYKGEQASVTDVLADRVDLVNASLSLAVPQIRAGKLKALGVISPSRVAALPDTPLVSEVIPGYEVGTFFGLFVPVGTPRAVIDRLYEIAAAALNAPGVQERVRNESLIMVSGRPDALAARVRADAEGWAKLMK